MPLTIENIKQAFPDEHPLYSIVSAKFKNTDIAEYDAAHKIFKINKVISVANGNGGYACPKHPKIKGRAGDKCFKCNKELEAVKQENHKELDVLNETDALSH